MFSALNMSGASQPGVVPLALRVIRGFSTCDGHGVVLGLRGSSARSSAGFSPAGSPVPVAAPDVAPGSASRTLAALLSEREAEGHRDLAVVLELHGAGDLQWVAEAISWLRGHGRRVVVRTDRVLPRAVVEAARDHGAAVVLRIASFDPAVQCALLGSSADATARLLLGAQHLRAQGVPVAVLIAPLMPVVHRDEVLASLVRHIAAADLRYVSFAIGGWSPARHRAVAPLLPPGSGSALARAYRVIEPEAVDLAPARAQLGLREASLLQRQAERIAEDAGLTITGCSCDAHCHLAPAGAPTFRSLLAPDLFSALTG